MGVFADFIEHHLRLVADDVGFMLGDVSLELFGRMFTGERIGVIAVGEEEHLDIKAMIQEHIDASEGGFDAGGIAIVD